MSLEPDILLVEKSVSRLAQDFLLDCGVTLIINVKPVRIYTGTQKCRLKKKF